MQSAFTTVFVTLLLLAVGPAFATDNPVAPGAPWQVAQTGKTPSACVNKCEKAKNDCFKYYTKSDSTSGTYVTPDGHKICWGAYHDCKKNCK